MSDSLATPWTIACQAPLPLGLPRQECWSGLPFPSPGDHLDPGIKHKSTTLADGFFTTEPGFVYTLMFIAALFTVTKTSKQTKCPSTEEWTKMWYIYTMEYYSAIKKHKIMSFTTKWMDIEILILKEVRQMVTDKYNMILLIWGFPCGLAGEGQDTQVQSMGQEDPLEEGMASYSSILAWRIPWSEQPGGLQSIGSERV